VRDDVVMSAVATPDRDTAVQRLPRLGYIPALDGLRALAVMAVLFYHGDVKWMPGGYLGVDVFFVISGYLITCLLLGDWRQYHAIRFGRFYLRRARRLLPALFLMLGVVALYSVLFLPDTLSELRGELFAAVAYIENWWLVFHDVSYFVAAGRPPLLRHLWSLAVEEQFYLVWPLMLAVILKFWGSDRRKVFGIVAGLAVLSALLMAVMYTPYHDPSRVYFGTDTRASTMLIGACLAFIWSPWRLTRQTAKSAPLVLDGFAAVGLVGVVWFFLNAGEFDPWMYRGGFTILALFAALLLAGTVHPASRLAPAVFGFSLFRWIGVRSYGIYLWHWPIYQVTRPHSDVPFTGIPLLLFRLALTFGAATLSFRFVEEPVRGGAIARQVALYKGSRGDARTRWNRRMGAVAGVVVVSIVIVVVGLGNGGSPGRPAGLPAEAATIVTSPTTAPDPATTTLVPNGAPWRVLAIGDSVMLGAAQDLADTVGPVKSIQVDAVQNRQFSQGVDTLQGYADRGQLPNDVVVVHLGTNGTINPDDFDRMMEILAHVRKVLIFNAKAPRPWEDQVNSTIQTEAKKYKNAVVIDWHTIGDAHPELFYESDEIHLKPEGAQFYADLVKQNL
jgi:peptidoglycan/LPS O-acetylase OafA/YrhL